MWRRRRQREADLDRELQSHLDLEAEEQGDPAAARRTLGNLAQIKEDTRAAWGWVTVERLARDLRYAARAMRRRPVFTAVAVLSLAIGIGANTAIFAFAEAILLRTLPVPHPDHLVILRQTNTTFHIENCCFQYGVFEELRRAGTGFEDILADRYIEVTFTESGQSERVAGEFVSPNFFTMLGVRAAAGRLLDASDNGPDGTGDTVVISHRLWQNRFGARADIAGLRVTLNGHSFRIVGVTQPGFTGASLHQPRDFQLPASALQKLLGVSRDTENWTQLIARRKPGVALDQALARVNAIGKPLERDRGYLLSDRDDFVLRDGSQGFDSQQDQLGRPVLVLLLLVGVVLLVACANLAALLLVRSIERTREAGLRIALGASRFTLFRQFFAESVLLALAGGAGGWLLALTLVEILHSLLGPQSAHLEVQAGADVFAFSAALTLASALLFGALPAWRAARANPLPAIQGSSIPPRRRPLLSRAIVAAQVALSLVLLFCAGLFTRTLGNLRAIDLGFHPENLVLVRPELTGVNFAGQEAIDYFNELRRRATELPEVRAASVTTLNVLSGSMSSVTLMLPAYQSPDGLRPTTYRTNASPDYFRTLGIPLLAGRDFTPADATATLEPVIVNQRFADRFLAGDPLGKTFSYGGVDRHVQVVGVAGTAKFRYVREEPQPILYEPFRPPILPALLQVRTAGDPAPTIGRLRALIATLDPRVTIAEANTMEFQIDAALARERLLAFLSTLLGGVAVALSAIGLYGVLAFSVVRRTREVGIRVAVGARRVSILALILKEAVWTVAIGLAIGLPLALSAGRLSATLLYGLEAEDTATAAGATLLLLLTATAAALIPALRATRLDPMTALRHE